MLGYAQWYPFMIIPFDWTAAGRIRLNLPLLFDTTTRAKWSVIAINDDMLKDK